MKLGYKPNALLSVFGERITYKGQDIKASVEIGEYDGKGSGFVDKALADKAQIWVRVKDVPEPRPKDEVYINGAKWYVDHVSNFDGTMYCLEIVHNVRAVRP
jgi:hypothetical protein|nr:MAG TPA: ATP-binding sugar transporter [Caudoviricetes sp.]